MQRLLVLVALFSLVTISFARADVLTPNDLKQLFKDGDYAGVVKGCADALASGGVTDPADLYKVNSLKAEALLKLGQADGAVDAFNEAAKVTAEPRQAFVAKATAILIGRSKDFVYTSKSIKSPQPKAEPAKPLASIAVGQNSTTTAPLARAKPGSLHAGQFDIVDPMHRTAALAAMWMDERADAERAIKGKLKTLAGINTALDRIHLSEPIAVAGGAPDWAQTQKEVLANAAKLDANTAIKQMTTRLATITRDQTVRRQKQPPDAMPQGQRDSLNRMIESLNQMTVSLKALPESLNVDKATFGPQLDDAAELQNKATTVLATD